MVSRRDSPFSNLDPATIAVRDVGGLNRQLTGALARSLGLGANDMEAIGELVQHSSLGAAELAARLGIRSASATALIDRLEQAGHAERSRDTVDRRRVSVVATASARRSTEETWGPVIGAIDAVSRELSDADRAVVVGYLDQVASAIREHYERAEHQQSGDRGAREPGADGGTRGPR